MKIFFLRKKDCSLAEGEDSILAKVRRDLRERPEVKEVANPHEAEAIVLQEEFSFKDWRYIHQLVGDPLIGRYPHKIYTVNTDDAANGLLPGVYTALPRSRFDQERHRAVPYSWFPTQHMVKRGARRAVVPSFLASWRGNLKSNTMRSRLLKRYGSSSVFRIESSQSWLDHPQSEKDYYVELLLSGKFSLCPAGWAAATFRIYESMAFGVAPVILADQFVEPRGPAWPSFCVRLPESSLSDLERRLQPFAEEWEAKGRLARKAWDRFFADDLVFHYYAEQLLECIQENLHRSDPSAETKRWRSRQLRWSNEWTVPQRARIKLKQILRRTRRKRED